MQGWSSGQNLAFVPKTSQRGRSVSFESQYLQGYIFAELFVVAVSEEDGAHGDGDCGAGQREAQHGTVEPMQGAYHEGFGLLDVLGHEQ